MNLWCRNFSLWTRTFVGLSKRILERYYPQEDMYYIIYYISKIFLRCLHDVSAQFWFARLRRHRIVACSFSCGADGTFQIQLDDKRHVYGQYVSLSCRIAPRFDMPQAIKYPNLTDIIHWQCSCGVIRIGSKPL